MKRFLTVLLSLFLGATALAFAACADNAPNGNASSDGSGQTAYSRHAGHGQQYFDRLFFGYGQYGETGELHT